MVTSYAPWEDTDVLTDKQIDEMRSLRSHEDMSLWGQGDKLREWALNRDDLAKLSELLQISVATLKQRERVAREFPPHTRDARHAFGVYSVFLGITNTTERMKVLNSRMEWTIEAAKEQVRLWRKRNALDGLSPGGSATLDARAVMRVGDIRVVGEMVGSQLKLTVEMAVSEPELFPIGHQLIVVCTVP